MRNFTMTDVREAVLSYLDESDIVPVDIDTEDYADEHYAMGPLCSMIYDVCQARGVNPADLPSDTFVGLLEKYDVK